MQHLASRTCLAGHRLAIVQCANDGGAIIPAPPELQHDVGHEGGPGLQVLLQHPEEGQDGGVVAAEQAQLGLVPAARCIAQLVRHLI